MVKTFQQPLLIPWHLTFLMCPNCESQAKAVRELTTIAPAAARAFRLLIGWCMETYLPSRSEMLRILTHAVGGNPPYRW